MAKNKETITPPSKALGKKASVGLRKGSQTAARVMADLSVAAREGVKRPSKGKSGK